MNIKDKISVNHIPKKLNISDDDSSFNFVPRLPDRLIDLSKNDIHGRTAENIQGARNYDAVIDQDKGGDYATIQDAIAAGVKRIFVRAGTYKIDADIILTDEISIVGENCGLTIIDFDSNDIGLKAQGQSASAYTTGTLSISSDSKVITGSGTSWSANVSAGDWIKLGNHLYEVDSVDNNTQITLKKYYRGIALSGFSYLVATFLKNITIKDLTFQNSGASVFDGNIFFKYVKSSLIKDIKIPANYRTAIYFEGVFNTVIRDNNLEDTVSAIELQGKNYFNTISGNNINNNQNSGVLLSGVNCYNKIVNNELNNGERGVNISANGDNNIVSQNHISYNHTHGIQVSGDNNIITENQVNNNTDDISDNGTDNIIDNNFK